MDIMQSQDLMDTTYGLLSAALGWGAQIPQTDLGPGVLRDKLPNLDWAQEVKPATMASSLNTRQSYENALDHIIPFVRKLADESYKLAQNTFPIVVGGDHAIAIGTWNGIVRASDATQQFGLLWIDAHLDSHTPQTSPSMAIHGMPLAVLLGRGDPRLLALSGGQPLLDPKHVVVFGARSFEEGEFALLTSLNVRIYKMEEIEERGVAICFKEAISIVNAAPKGFGISLDLDAFDPIEAPGVGSPEPNGLHVKDVLDVFPTRREYPSFKGCEIAEYNPTRDQQDKCVRIVDNFIRKIKTND